MFQNVPFLPLRCAIELFSIGRYPIARVISVYMYSCALGHVYQCVKSTAASGEGGVFPVLKRLPDILLYDSLIGS
jgi:hypothetical protein